MAHHRPAMSGRRWSDRWSSACTPGRGRHRSAVGGVAGTRFAATAVVVFVVVTWFVQLLGPLLELPDVRPRPRLTSHYGQPMVGSWDGAGIVASLALAIGGVLVGAWGFARRDLRG